MKKSINRRVIYIAMIITLLSTYMLPAQRVSEFSKSFGYPFGWFTVFNDSIGDIILTSTQVDPLSLLGNIMVWYYLIFLLSRLIKIFKQKQNEVNI